MAQSSWLRSVHGLHFPIIVRSLRCKSLRAVASVQAKNWARDDTKLSDADGYRGERALTIAYSQTTPVPLSLDTGPPGVRSFAELILQQSLLAHAPPSLA